MSAARLFGTDGIRGLANAEPLTPEMAVAFGRALAMKFGAEPGTAHLDRARHAHFWADVGSGGGGGNCFMGGDVRLLGVLPTRPSR